MADRRKLRIGVSASVRIAGALLVLGGLIVGLRVLGPSQFGISVMLLAVGQLLAFPITAMERLLVRLVAQGHGVSAGRVLRRSMSLTFIGLALAITLVVIAYLSGKSHWALYIAASSVTALSAGIVSLRQGVNRAAGDLFWGQVPNELFRPLVTLGSYFLAVEISPEWSGLSATVIASAATLIFVLSGPNLSKVDSHSNDSQRGVRGAALSLMAISIVVLGVERLYPILLGVASSSTAVAIFAVALRVVQIANFTQAFAIFYYSPALAETIQNRPGALGPITRRIRAMSLLAAIPVAATCIFLPGLLGSVLAPDLNMSGIFPLVALAVVAQAVGGPSQTAMLMAGRESWVAVTYIAGSVASFSAYFLGGASSAVSATLGLAIAFIFWNGALVVLGRRTFGAWH